MKKYNTRAVILKSINYKDSDRLYTVFSEDHGKVTAVAHGVRKITSRRSGGLDSLNFVSLGLSEDSKGFKSIDEVKTLNSFKHIKANLSISLKAYYIGELLYKTTEEGFESEKLFELLVIFLKALNTNPAAGDLLVSYFEANFLEIMGYGLSFKKCSVCGKPVNETWGKYYFSLDTGNLTCDSCASYGFEVSLEALKTIVKMLGNKIPATSGEAATREVSELLKSHIQSTFGVRFKTLSLM